MSVTDVGTKKFDKNFHQHHSVANITAVNFSNMNLKRNYNRINLAICFVNLLMIFRGISPLS